MADRLINFLSGDGKEMAQVMFVPHERQVLQSYADLLRKMQIPQVGANWSNNYKIVEMLGKVAKVVGGAVGAVIGHAAGGGYLGTAAGAVAGERIAGIGQKFGDISRARQISRQMPLVTDAMRKWAKAVHQAQKNNSPPSMAAASSAGVNLMAKLRLFAPVLFRLASHRWRVRVLELQPVRDQGPSISVH